MTESAEEGSSSLEISDEVQSEEEVIQRPPSQARFYREIHNGTRPVEAIAELATRPLPQRHEPPSVPKTPKLQKVSTLYNFGFIEKVPVAEIKSNKKEKRKEREVVEPAQVQVLFFFPP
jgi:hypothetical protein